MANVIPLKKTLALFLALTTLTSCQIPYLINNTYHQLALLSQRTKTEDVLKEKNLPKEIKEKLLISKKAKFFAEKKLHLKKTQNYTTYVKLNRPHVTYVVNAAPKFNLENHLWWFPIIGHVPYKGFFNRKDAQRLSKELQKKGLDTYIRGVSAYSTLGWFDDPLLSSMMRYSEHNLVNTIIHETVHATIYIKDHADFNERLATYIGDLGTQLFYLQHEGPSSPTVLNITNELHDQKLFSQFISLEIKNMTSWYSSQKEKTEPIKKLKLQEIQNRFLNKILPKMKTSNFHWFTKETLNNARLMLLSTYMKDLSLFEQLYKRHNKDFQLFINSCKELENSLDPEKDLKAML